MSYCRTLIVSFPHTLTDRLLLEDRMRKAGGLRVSPCLWCVQSPLWEARHLRAHLTQGLRDADHVAVVEASDWALGRAAEHHPNPYVSQL